MSNIIIEMTHTGSKQAIVVTMDAGDFKIEPLLVGKQKIIKVTFNGTGEINSFSIQFPRRVGTYLAPGLSSITEGFAAEMSANLKPMKKL